MTETLHSRLDQQFEQYSIERQLHDVPPHEVYEVSVDGQRAVYKANTGPTGRAGIEGRVLSLVDTKTTLPVPEPLALGANYYVAGWHPDAPSPDEDQHADTTWARAAGKGLARLHRETEQEIDSYGQFQVSDGELTVSGCESWHAGAIEFVETYRPTLEQYGHADMADAVIEYLDANPNAFEGVETAVCCHGWASPEHVAVVDSEVACLVDFEHAIAAPGEFDFWRTVMPTFGGMESDEPQAQFREGYESVRSLPDGLDRRQPLYGLLNGIYFFESLYVQEQHDPEETTEQAKALRSSIHETLDQLKS